MSTALVQMFPLKKILVATDGSENAKRAIEVATILAKLYDSELIILNVIAAMVPPVYSGKGVAIPATDYYSNYFEQTERSARKIVNEAVDKAKGERVNARGAELRTMSSIPEAILKNDSEENVNLIVVGTRGLGGFKKLLLGSASSAVVAHAHCAVLVIR